MTLPSMEEIVALIQGGHLTQAVADLRSQLAQKPDHAEAHHLLGLVLYRRGETAEGLSLLRRAADLGDAVVYRLNLANALLQEGDPNAALPLVQAIIKRDRKNGQAHTLAAGCYLHLGHLDDAERAYARACRLLPQAAEPWNNRGLLARRRGDDDLAAQHFQRALKLEPAYQPALINLANLAQANDRLDQAEDLYRKALKQKHQDAVQLSLAHVLQKQGDHAQARTQYENYAKAKPQDPLAHLRAAMVMPLIPESTDQIDACRQSYRQALDSCPPMDLEPLLDRLPSSGLHPPYHLVYQNRDNLKLRQVHAACFTAPNWDPPKGNPGQKPHIGMLVTRGHEGIFLNCCAGLIQHFPTQEMSLTLVVHASKAAAVKAQLGLEHIEIIPYSDPFTQVIQTLRSRNLDLLYYWEVGSDAVNYFLPFFRIAKRQVTSWGTSESSGHPMIDTYLSAVPWNAAPHHFSEHLISLPTLPAHFNMPGPPSAITKSELGLSPKERHYLCPQNLFKLHPDVDPLFAQLLDRDPNGRILLVTGKHAAWTSRLTARMTRSGLPMDRITFLPRQSYADYLALLSLADVILDSLYFTGGATSYEALSQAAPVVTLPGDRIHGNFTAGYYRQMGFTELIAQDVAHYVDLAVQTAAKPDFRRHLTQQIEANRPRILEQNQASQAFWAALRSLAVA